MRSTPNPVLFVLIGCLGGGGCVSADGGEQLTESQELRADREDVAFDPVEGASSFVSGITDRRRLVIDEPEEWSDFWAELSANVAPTPDPPSLDFGSQVVIAATMGQRPTGGYFIRIEGVSRAGAELRVVVVETSPAADCLTTQAFTAPSTAVTVPRPVGEVDFVEEAETRDCS